MKRMLGVLMAAVLCMPAGVSAQVPAVDAYLEASGKRVKKAGAVIDLLTVMNKPLAGAKPLIDGWLLDEREGYQATKADVPDDAQGAFKAYAAKALQCIEAGLPALNESLRAHQARQTQCASELAEKRAALTLDLPL